MILNLNEINNFSRCPRYFRYISNMPVTTSRYADIVNYTIKKAYNLTTESGFRIETRRIVSLVDKQVFKDVDVENKKDFTYNRSLSEKILLITQKWNEKFYSKEETGGYTDITIEKFIGTHHTIQDTLPIVLPLDIPVITIIEEQSYTKTQLVNNIKYRGYAWLLFSSLNCDEICIRHISIGDLAGFVVNEFTINKKMNQNVENIILQIAESINSGIDYPARSMQCESCYFKWKCKY